NVRRYYFPGTTHGGGRGGFSAAVPASPGACELPGNSNSQADTMRALIVALTNWVVKDSSPPPSQYPRLDQNQLVWPRAAAMGFPAIPGWPLPDNLLNTFLDYDFGTEFNYNDLSGVLLIQPPIIKRVLPLLVPKVNADGNETSGVASALHQAPLGTYLGWNVTRGGFYKGRVCGFSGSFIPFAKNKAEREAAGDPRPSLEERYRDHAGYVAAVRAAVERLLQQKFLLPEDAERLIREAETGDVLR
ncbi:MAG: alpha/beta hydrolase domain-containing protein, partial [Acidobacteriota bacterium]